MTRGKKKKKKIKAASGDKWPSPPRDRRGLATAGVCESRGVAKVGGLRKSGVSESWGLTTAGVCESRGFAKVQSLRKSRVCESRGFAKVRDLRLPGFAKVGGLGWDNVILCSLYHCLCLREVSDFVKKKCGVS